LISFGTWPDRNALDVARNPSRFKLRRELRDNIPTGRLCSGLKGARQCLLDGACTLQVLWPKRNQLTRTYVSSRRLSLRERA